MLEILSEIDADLETVTLQEIERAQRRLDPVQRNEKVLGTVHNRDVIRLQALSTRYTAMARMAAHQAVFESDSDEEEQSMKARGARLAALASLARELFWIQAREDLGGSAWTADGVGIRQKWVLVATLGKEESGPPAILKKLLGGDGE